VLAAARLGLVTNLVTESPTVPFDDMLGRLDAAFEGQRQFVGNASHELKTPLAINRTLLAVALNRPNVPAELRHLGETLLEVNARHERLVDGLPLERLVQNLVHNAIRHNTADGLGSGERRPRWRRMDGSS